VPPAPHLLPSAAIRSSSDAPSPYQAIFEMAGIGMTEADPATRRFVRVNRKFCEITGYSEPELLGLTYLDVTHPDDRDANVVQIDAVIQGDRHEWSSEKRYIRKDGAIIWVQVDGTLLCDESGIPLRTVAVTQDITERRRAEEALRAADRRKDEFLALLGHELRNPLAGIASGVELLNLIGGGEPDAVETRAILDRQVTQMRHLIDDLLDVSRITRGKIALRRETLNLVELVQNCINDQLRTPAAQTHSVRTQLPADALWVDGDSTRLSQVVTNLIHNALKFTDHDGDITVRVAPSGAGAEISVRDTGIGIASPTMARLFEPFSQADASIERSRGGLGLGLAIVRGISELHGGRAWAESRGLGYGATFRVWLPTCDPPCVGEACPLVASPPVSQQRVLIIDDQADAAIVLRKLLERAGHQVVVACDGPLGMEMAREFLPEVVLCDIGLPGGMNGYQVASRFRNHPALRTAYLVAVTGYGQEEDRRDAQAAGFDYHVTKPVSHHQLQQILGDRPRFSD
jgi:PAS domain S-box-containing protein